MPLSTKFCWGQSTHSAIPTRSFKEGDFPTAFAIVRITTIEICVGARRGRKRGANNDQHPVRSGRGRSSTTQSHRAEVLLFPVSKVGGGDSCARRDSGHSELPANAI